MFKPTLAEIAPYRVATPPHSIKLNQNEGTLDLPSKLRKEILSRMASTDWRRYPPFPADGVVRRLGKRLRVAKNRILMGHGSNEIVLSAALATLRRGSRVVVPTPSFPVFERVARVCEAKVVRVPLRDDLQYDADRLVTAAGRPGTRLTFLASPNNPTGSSLTNGEIAAIASTTPGLVVIDEAYAEFSSKNHRALIDEHENVVISRTFSKAFALASLRLGYAFGAPDVMTKLEAATLPFSIDGFAQVAAEAVLDHPKLVREGVRQVRSERERVRRVLQQTPGIETFPSEANFLLIRTADANRVWKGLLERGILVRDVSAGPGLQDCLRITVGRPSENDAVLGALSELV